MSEPSREAGLEAYLEAIEQAMRTHRGTEHVLAPREFALAKGYHEAGVSLATVLVAIDAAFEADPRTASLAACRRRIEELAAPGSGRAAHDVERASLPEIGERLDALRERLLELPGRAAGLPLAELGELADLVAVSSRPNWEYLREKLHRLDALVGAAAVEALEPGVAEELRAEAARTAERQRGRVDARALDEVVDRLYRLRARERLRLPRVSVI